MSARKDMEGAGRVVMVAVDLTSHSAEPLLAALELVGANPNSTIHLLSVLDTSKRPDTEGMSLLAHEESFLADTPARLLARMRTATLGHARPEPRAKVVAHARIGAVVEVILQACVDHDVDLLICGTQARSGLARMLQGSVAEALVRAAHCPVHVARRKSYRGLARTVLPDPPPAPGERPARVLTPRPESPVTSRNSDSWEPSDNGPTGFRIV